MKKRSVVLSILLGVAPTSTTQHQADCLAGQRATPTLRLDDSRAIYVEPMAFAAGAESRLIAGHPVYLWTQSHAGSARLDSSAAVAGVVIRDTIVAPLIAPFADGIVTDYRLRAEGRRFQAVFARAIPADKRGHDPTVASYWFGRTDGVTWDSLESLPLPPGALISSEASPLVRVGDALMLAVPFGNDTGRDVALYVRERGRWRVEIVRAQGAAYVALAVGAGGDSPLLYVVRPDTTNLPDANSLSLFTRDPDGTWRDRGVLLRGGKQPVHHPAARELDGRWTLSWFTDDDMSHARVAHAARIGHDGTLAGRTVLGENVVQLSPVHAASGPARWIVTSRSDSGERQLVALVEWADGAATLRDLVNDPFEGSMLAYAGSDGVVAVGPALNRAPGAESLVSGTLRFVLRCDSRVRGGPGR